jgi:hypothetical protein
MTRRSHPAWPEPLLALAFAYQVPGPPNARVRRHWPKKNIPAKRLFDMAWTPTTAPLYEVPKALYAYGAM